MEAILSTCVMRLYLLYQRLDGGWYPPMRSYLLYRRLISTCVVRLYLLYLRLGRWVDTEVDVYTS